MLTFIYIGILLILDLKGGDYNGNSRTRSCFSTPRIAFMGWYAKRGTSFFIFAYMHALGENK